MDNDIKQHLRSITILSGVLTLLVVATNTTAPSGTSSDVLYAPWAAQVGSSRTFTTTERRAQPIAPQTFEERIAYRLQARLRTSGSRVAPPLTRLVEAVKQRQALLARYADVRFEPEGKELSDPWRVSAQRYPLWIIPRFSTTDAAFAISPSAIRDTLAREQVLALDPPVNAVLTAVLDPKDEKSARRVGIDGVAKHGYLPDPETVSVTVAGALEAGVVDIVVSVPKTAGRIVNMTGLDLGDLELIATGLSNFKGSIDGRVANVRKALNEHVNNVIVAPGETFSFNSTLDGPVSQGNGWHMAKVIYNGGDLEFAPGGGICQASTTVYRAAVLAGLPILKRKAHSLYVSYYKAHGVGIDATIYPGTQDLVFENDTPSYLLIQSYSDGFDAFVNLYGTPDGRTVELNGPYFASTAPEGMTVSGREIVWQRNVYYPNGAVSEYTISSKYKDLPQISLAKEFPPEQTVHASAPGEKLGMR